MDNILSSRLQVPLLHSDERFTGVELSAGHNGPTQRNQVPTLQ